MAEIHKYKILGNHLTNICQGLMIWTDFLFKIQFYGPIVPMKPTMTMIIIIIFCWVERSYMMTTEKQCPVHASLHSPDNSCGATIMEEWKANLFSMLVLHDKLKVGDA